MLHLHKITPHTTRRSDMRNVPLLLDVAQTIEDEPDDYIQTHWGSFRVDVEGDEGEHSHNYFEEWFDGNYCGTSFCICGWAMIKRGWTVRAEKMSAWTEERPVFQIRWTNPDGQDEHCPNFGYHGANYFGFGYEVDSNGNPDGDARLCDIFEASWEPREGLSVPDALRAIAGGASYEAVTHEYDSEDEDSATLESVMLLVEHVKRAAA